MKDIKWNHAMIQALLVFILLGIVLITCGCIENTQSNITTEQTLPPASPSSPPTAPPSLTTAPLSQNLTIINPITIVTTVTPHFTGTITYGSNRSSALTEDQAWNYAAVYLDTWGIHNIQPSEIEPLGQHTWIYENGTQTMGWGFKVYHTTTPNGLRYVEGIIDIDAYDGHVLMFAPLD